MSRLVFAPSLHGFMWIWLDFLYFFLFCRKFVIQADHPSALSFLTGSSFLTHKSAVGHRMTLYNDVDIGEKKSSPNSLQRRIQRERKTKIKSSKRFCLRSGWVEHLEHGIRRQDSTPIREFQQFEESTFSSFAGCHGQRICHRGWLALTMVIFNMNQPVELRTAQRVIAHLDLDCFYVQARLSVHVCKLAMKRIQGCLPSRKCLGISVSTWGRTTPLGSRQTSMDIKGFPSGCGSTAGLWVCRTDTSKN